MPANTSPIFSRAPDIQIADAVLGPTANTNTDGTSSATSSAVIFQSDTTEGGFVQKVILKAVGSPAATVVRVYVCSVTGAFTMGTSNTAANTRLVTEATLPAITLSQTAASPQFELPLNFAMPAGWRLLISFGTTTGAAGNGYSVTTIGGKY